MKSKLFAHKSSIVTVQPVLDGTEKYKVTDQYGDIDYITQTGLDSQFVEVKEKQNCGFSYEDMAAGYASMMQLNQEEDERYINGTAELNGLDYKW